MPETPQELEQPDLATPKITQPEFAARKAVLFLDLNNTSMAEYRGMEKHPREFLNQISVGRWSVMLAVLTNTGRAGVVVPFTEDSNKIMNAFKQQQPNAHRDIAVMNRKREISRLLELYPSRETIEKANSLASQYAKQEKSDAEKSL